MSLSARLGLLTLLWTAPVAHAAPTKVRLEYLRDATATRCPTEEVLRESIAARLGRDPTDALAPGLLRVRVRREEGRWRGTVELFGASGEPKGRRELSSAREDCQELTQALELAIALLLDPPTFRQPEAAPPPPALLPPPEPSRHVQASPEGPPSPPPEAAVALGARLSWGLLPGMALGFNVDGGLRFERFSLALDATAWVPRTHEFAQGGLRSTLLTAGARACVHSGPFGACPRLSAGVLWCEGVGLEDARSVRAPWLAPGARLFREWHLPTPGLRLQVLAEGQILLTRSTFFAGDVALWQTPLFAASMGVMGVWETGP